jgi:hypothetical protein
MNNTLYLPRFKVVADYPGNEFLIGDIFTFTQTFDFEPEDKETEVWYDEKNCVFMDIVQKYPHLFKKLEWWQDRKPEEMPEEIVITPAQKAVDIDSLAEEILKKYKPDTRTAFDGSFAWAKEKVLAALKEMYLKGKGEAPTAT